MLKDDQDHLNVGEPQTDAANNPAASKEKWIVDRKAYGSDNTPEAIARNFTNAVRRDHHVRLGPLNNEAARRNS